MCATCVCACDGSRVWLQLLLGLEKIRGNNSGILVMGGGGAVSEQEADIGHQGKGSLSLLAEANRWPEAEMALRNKGLR